MKNYILLLCITFLMQMATAQTCKDTIPASTPDSRFILNGDEVIDTETGLIWQRCSLGQTGSDCSGGSANRYNWQEALLEAGAPWRLPNINELRSLMESKCFLPAINLTIFPNTVLGNYWSASPRVTTSVYAWGVEFAYGWSDFGFRSNLNYVRLVRGG